MKRRWHKVSCRLAIDRCRFFDGVRERKNEKYDRKVAFRYAWGARGRGKAAEFQITARHGRVVAIFVE